MTGKMIVITGLPASGKDTVVTEFTKKNPDFSLIVSHTDRPMRPGETQGAPHHFVDKRKFESLIKNDELLEHVKTGLYYKGTSKEEFSKILKGYNLVWRIEMTRFLTFEETIYEKFETVTARGIILNSKKILIKPENKEVASERYRSRDKKGDMRDFHIRWDMEYDLYRKNKDKFPHIVINRQGKIEEALAKIENVIKGS